MSILMFLRNKSMLKLFYMGYLVKKEKINCVKENIWYILKEEYFFSFFFLFVFGSVFIVSMDVVKMLVFYVNFVKMVYLDEVFLGFVVMFSDVIFMYLDFVMLENCGGFKGKLVCNMFLFVDDVLYVWMEFINSNVCL